MALDDICTFAPASDLNGDTLTAVLITGPGSVATWRLRDGLIDLHEREGDAKFAGQGDLLAFRAWLEAAGTETFEMLQLGVDQFGRLVGDIRYHDDASNWSVVAAGQGRGQIGSISFDGSTATVTFPERRPGAGFGGPLIVDTTRP